MPLLWASAYFVPELRRTSIYLLPSDDLFGLVFLPSLIVVAGGALLLYLVSAVRQSIPPRVAACCAVLGLAAMAVIALKVLISAAGYAWEELIPQGGDFELTLRVCKYGIAIAMIAIVWGTRNALLHWSRVLGSLGTVLGALAVIRLVTVSVAPHGHPPGTFTTTLTRDDAANPGEVAAVPSRVDVSRRRVVWIIFDETDFDRVYGSGTVPRSALPNFSRLASMGVFATDANSPASATLYSIPALLTAVPIGGVGIRIDDAGALSLERVDGAFVPFDEATSLFGILEKDGRSVSALGFYEPYCRLFKLHRCDSYPWPKVGGLDVALWKNVPDFLVRTVQAGYSTGPAYFGAITSKLLNLLPAYLARDDALTYVHLNIPHLPATYADTALHVKASRDPLVEYSRNLLVSDRILGELMQSLENQTSRHDLVLIVSTDHWLRKSQYRGSGPEVRRRIPFIVWKVGDDKGVVLTTPVSTVHTSAMILDYLNGRISTQADIAKWWDDQKVYPSFIAPGS